MSKGTISELYKDMVKNVSFDETAFGYRYNYSEKEFKKGKEQLEFTIASLDKQSDEAVLESDKSYYKDRLWANPILLAWHCMKLKVNELEERNKQLEKLLDEVQNQRTFYRQKQEEFVRLAAGGK